MSDTATTLVLVGPMGAGKSAIGRRLAERLGLPFADLDEDIEAATGASIASSWARPVSTQWRYQAFF